MRSRAEPPRATPPADEPVRLGAPVIPSPFAPGRGVTFARLDGALLAPSGLRDGDHVALVSRASADDGGLASVVGADGRSALWRVYRDGASVAVSASDRRVARRLTRSPRIEGVVVGVLRRLG